MILVFDVKFKIELHTGVTLVSVDRDLELSLDCFVCARKRRTVRVGEATSLCHPGSGFQVHEFPAKITSIVQDNDSWTYTVEAVYQPFLDLKLKTRSAAIEPTRILVKDLNDVFKPGHPAVPWARAGFKVKCSCGEERKTSIQTNVTRPYQLYCDECANYLIAEKQFWPRVTQVVVVG